MVAHTVSHGSDGMCECVVCMYACNYTFSSSLFGRDTCIHVCAFGRAEVNWDDCLSIYLPPPLNLDYSGNQSRLSYGKPLHASTDVMTHMEDSARYHPSFEGTISYPNEMYSSSRTVPVRSILLYHCIEKNQHTTGVFKLDRGLGVSSSGGELVWG